MPTASTAIAEARAKADEALDRSWLGRDSMDERFDAFRALPDDARAAWLGHAVARTLEASVFGGSQRTCTFHDHLGRLLGIDVAKWWRPTALNWFDRVAKAQCLAALEEVGGSELAARHAKSKKGEIAESCERVFAGSAIIDADIKAKALGWVPEPMRFGADDSPPWAVEDEGEADNAAEDVEMVISDETAVTDATSDRPGDADTESAGVTAGKQTGDVLPSDVAAEPLGVTFVADDPGLEGVRFTFEPGTEDRDTHDDTPGMVELDQAA